MKEAKTPELSDSEKRKAKFLIYKNVLLISASFLLLFVAFESMSKLQSSINKVFSNFISSSFLSYSFLKINNLQFHKP